ncbi:hypothetical protein PENTCL1PPCAC_8052, partial [Pristionchus entomophagus]
QEEELGRLKEELDKQMKRKEGIMRKLFDAMQSQAVMRKELNRLSEKFPDIGTLSMQIQATLSTVANSEDAADTLSSDPLSMHTHVIQSTVVNREDTVEAEDSGSAYDR